MHKNPSSMSKIKTVMIKVTLVAAMSLNVYASDMDMTGKWTLLVKSDKSSGTPVFDLKQDGKGLTGMYKGRYGESPVSGTVENDRFEITYILKGQKDETVTVVYAGKFKDNTCQGNADFGSYGKATFTGKR